MKDDNKQKPSSKRTARLAKPCSPLQLMDKYITHSMCKERGRDINASRMVYFRANGTRLQNVSLKYKSIVIRYAILTTILSFSMITNPGTCVLLNDVVNCKEYIVLVVDDYIYVWEYSGEKICSTATLASTNPTWIDMRLNLGLCGESPMSNSLSYGIAPPPTHTHTTT